MRFAHLSCLITDYALGSCRECVEICYQEAFGFEKPKITLDSTLCTDCFACVGVCPTEAISGDFDENIFTLEFADSKDTLISCKQNTPCLAAFDAHHYLSLLIRGDRMIEVELSNCHSCEIDRDQKVSNFIKNELKKTNDLAEELSLDQRIVIQETSQNERRGFFKKLLTASKSVIKEQENTAPITRTKTPTPKKMILLQNALSKLEKLPKSLSTINDYEISDKCTACGDCVAICPTGAISWSDASLVMSSYKCVGCDYCVDTCEPKAVTKLQNPDLVLWANKDDRVLISFSYTDCDSCGQPFVSVDQTTCKRCKDFDDEFGDMFKSQAELEG